MQDLEQGECVPSKWSATEAMVRSGVRFQLHLPDLAVRFHIFCPLSILSPTWFPGDHTLHALFLLYWPGFRRALCCFLLIPYILKHLVDQPFSWSVSSTPFWFIEILITPALHACPPPPSVYMGHLRYLKRNVFKMEQLVRPPRWLLLMSFLFSVDAALSFGSSKQKPCICF